MQIFNKIVTGLFTVIKEVSSYLTELLGKENGIRSLYVIILCIPSVCLLWLYNREIANNEKLVLENKELRLEANRNYQLYVTAKDSLRATLFEEYIELAKAMNELQESLKVNNDSKSKELLRKSKNVKNELNKIEEYE